MIGVVSYARSCYSAIAVEARTQNVGGANDEQQPEQNRCGIMRDRVYVLRELSSGMFQLDPAYLGIPVT
jgi:hypothetical protein